MSDAMIAQFSQNEITGRDRELAEELIANAPKDSSIAQLLQRILASTDRGIDITVLAADGEVTPNQAASLLNMSRPHLLSFMDTGELPFHRVGETQKHRKIKMSDLRVFMAARDAGKQIAADALHASSSNSEIVEPLSPEEIGELESL
ncbi:MAG: helix-turn-helix domain-containing protein [Corynebacterium sp.]|uniref:helix-turn-helix domain-containing protein n=1 Tax=Corynebacterium casei TaxID=160386 RepID=UPI003FD58932